MILYNKIVEEINKAKEVIEHNITKGQISNYESYRFNIGRLQGLQDAIDICHDIIKGGLNE